MSQSPLPQAYKLVRQILSSSPYGLHTKDIVRQGVALYADKLPREALDNIPEPVNERIHKGKKKHVPEKQLVPEGHPFISTSFLKNRVLPVLQSQNLIHKHPVHPKPSELDPSSPSAAKRGNAKLEFVWSLREQPADLPEGVSWSTAEQWERFIQGEHPGLVGRDYKEMLEQIKVAKRKEAIESGKARRTDEEIRAWEGRRVGVTTEKERYHLNKRREANRPRKEWKNQEEWQRLLNES
ncbi:hypothetical protein L198_01465 [Cryptococcus wingfieldii CBS 7118]|uniref:Uncharacterized protein n=1 Tax=Cryptococcus wingfieldii CBS 7118 TaxID=1295528 RepID=A0A1E3JZM3_9TREE|nr:hypothetical protein L198_01465 [Cryptococcus wingfieldii CBS 7118]ODO06233.1 hypothetical protein L198_01465 [Cryptococcus wingfieldii CBS 7118]